MRGKKKRPLPWRTLRMDRKGRLQSARPWLAEQRGRPSERVARSYRKRYGVDWVCAIQELTALGLAFDPKWRQQLDLSLEGAKRAKARRKEEQEANFARCGLPESDENFAFIVGYTEGGAPFGMTWEEQKEIELGQPGALAEQPHKRDARELCDDELPPF